jgi:hypothetical protein
MSCRRNFSPPVAFSAGTIQQELHMFHSGIHPSFTAMNPGSPSCHPSEAEEEDSPLQQSAQGAHPSMADSYPEDITSEAEEEMAGMATEEPTDKEVDVEAEEEEQDDGGEAEEEQIP